MSASGMPPGGPCAVKVVPSGCVPSTWPESWCSFTLLTCSDATCVRNVEYEISGADDVVGPKMKKSSNATSSRANTDVHVRENSRGGLDGGGGGGGGWLGLIAVP